MSVVTIRPKANFRADVSDPTTLKSEELFKVYCLRRGWTCLDRRWQRRPYDFEVYAGKYGRQLVDVKCDRYFDERRNIVFEVGNIYQDGTTRPTWGASEMTWLAVVAVPSWTLIIVDLAKFRAIVEGDVDGKYKPKYRENDFYTTEFRAVPLIDIFVGNALIAYQTEPFWMVGDRAA